MSGSVTGVFSVSHPLDVALLLIHQELQQFCACSVVPDQVGVLRVTVQQLQHLTQPWERSLQIHSSCVRIANLSVCVNVCLCVYVCVCMCVCKYVSVCKCVFV